MDISFTRKTILYVLVFLWMVFSVVYIANDVWSRYKKVQLVQAYEQGRTDIINQLIREAEKCEPIPVFSEGKEINLLKIGCQEISQ